MMVCKRHWTRAMTGILAICAYLMYLERTMNSHIGHAQRLYPAENESHYKDSSVPTYKQRQDKSTVHQMNPVGLRVGDAPDELQPDASLKEMLLDYIRIMQTTDVKCGKHKRIGNVDDGGWHVCLDPGYQLKPGCLVYDFGIATKWKFDDALKLDYHCRVRAFDPTNGFKEHERKPNLNFYPVGLYGYNGKMVLKGRNCSVQTLGSLLDQFGERQTIIDYLKIDVEYSEWSALDAMLREGALQLVKQIGIELHIRRTLSPSTVYWYLRILQQLKSSGFRIWKSNWNKRHDTYRVAGVTTKCCYELYFVNTNNLT